MAEYPQREYIVRETEFPLGCTTKEEVGELIRCKNCEFYEDDHWEKIDKFPVIVANHVCMKWGKGCQTDPDGYCFLAERKDGDSCD